MSDNTENNQDKSVLKIFEEGKRFTEELLRENEKLRLLIGNLRNEKRELENRYIKVDVPRMQEKVLLLEEECRQLRQELQEIKDQYVAIEEENWEFAERYIEVERQNSNLINMYVASYRLHSTLEYREVIQIVKEIIINMIGSEQFGVYVHDEEAQQLVLIAEEGLEGVENYQKLGEGVIANTLESGQPYMADEEDIENGKIPVACIPLKVGEKVVGVIVIEKLLIQKDGFKALDFDLFEMLGGHSATAIYGSQLYSLSERKRSTLEGFLELLKNDLNRNLANPAS